MRPRIIGDLEEAGPVDVIFLGVKAHGLTQLAPQLKPLISRRNDGRQHAERHSLVVFRETAPLGTRRSRRRHRAIDSAHNVVGSIVYFATEIVEPGVIRHNEGNRISLGEPDGTRSDACRAIAEALIKAGLRAPVHHAAAPRNLGEAAGQRRVQPDQRPDPRDAGADGRATRKFARWSAIS